MEGAWVKARTESKNERKVKANSEMPRFFRKSFLDGSLENFPTITVLEKRRRLLGVGRYKGTSVESTAVKRNHKVSCALHFPHSPSLQQTISPRAARAYANRASSSGVHICTTYNVRVYS